MTSAAEIVGANVRRLRHARGVSLVELGRLSGLAKGTLTHLEAGRANPTVDTLHALSRALGASLGDLVAELPDPAPRVVRAGAGTPVPGWAFPLHLVHRAFVGGTIVEQYRIEVPAGTNRPAPAHAAGVVEQVFVLEGSMLVGPEGATVTLGPGDSARFDGDHPHRYATPDGPARALVHMLLPTVPPGSASHPLLEHRLPAPGDRPDPRRTRPASPEPSRQPPREPGRPIPQVPVRGVRPASRAAPPGIRPKGAP